MHDIAPHLGQLDRIERARALKSAAATVDR
jgi:hypothetical protein